MDLSISQHPIGTLEELRAAGRDPRYHACCHEPKGDIKGCAKFHECVFVKWRDQLNGKKGPCNVGVAFQSGTTKATDQRVLTCQQFMGYPMKMRENAAKTGDRVQVVAYEGGTIRTRVTRRLHETSDPSCMACRKGNCNARKSELVEVRVPEFPRIGANADDALAYAIETEGLIAQKEREELLEAAGPMFAPGVEDEPEAKPRGRRA